MLMEVKLFLTSPANQQQAQTTESAPRVDVPGKGIECVAMHMLIHDLISAYPR